MNDARIEVEAILWCPSCRGTPYRLFRREVPGGTGVFTHQLWPTSSDILPPTDPTTMRCPSCHVPLQRKAP